MGDSGFLAIWSDLAPQDETDWIHWITREHAAERVNIDGFLACRIFRALGVTANRYFILYDLESPEVVGGPQYLARLDAPTPWTQRIMGRVRKFARGGGRVLASAGSGEGGILAVLPLDASPQWDAAALVAKLASFDRIAAARVLLTDAAQTSIRTREKSIRNKDNSFAGLLLVEGLDEQSVRNALLYLRSLVPQEIDAIEELPLYRLFFSLPKRLLPVQETGRR